MNLVQHARVLADQWHATRAQWRDAKALEFEQRYLEPLPRLMQQSGIVMNELDTLLKKIRHDCEPPH